MDVVTIGETMVLFTPESVGSFRHANKFEKTLGGAESNVAIALSRLGHKAGWISRLGNDDFGMYVRNYIRGEGVDTSQVIFDQNHQTGVFFKERKSLGEPKVFYYRKHSAASQLQPSDINEDYIAKARYLHITGITPALSETAQETILHAISLARKNHLTVVFDPNIRLRLWSKEEASKVLNSIAQMCDIVLPGVEEGKILTGETEPELIAAALLKGETKCVVVKNGAKGVYYKTIDEDGHVPGVVVEKVIDPIGAGDGFAAGLLSGLIQNLSISESIRRAHQVAAYALSVPGDVEGYPSLAELTSNDADQIFR